MLNYSKFIFRNGLPVAPKKAPSQAPGIAPRLSATQKKSVDFVKKKDALVKKMKGDTERLYDYWKNNNPKGKEEFIEEEVKFRALREIKNSAEKKEAYLMLSLIQKHWSKDKAKQIYASCWSGSSFKLSKLTSFFSAKEVASRLGFYYGTRTITWYTKPDWGYYLDKEKKKWVRTNFVTKEIFTSNTTTVKLTGWWTWDEGDTNNNRVEGGKDFYKDAIKKIKGDEWVGESLFKALKSIKGEMSVAKGRPGYNDSGLSPEREKEMVEFLKDEEQNVRGMSETKAKKDTVKYLKRYPKQWVSLEKDLANKMSFVYGVSAGMYKFRYEPDRNKIFFIRIDGAPINKSWGIGGYLDIKNGETGKWNGMNEKTFKPFIKKELLDHMTVEKVRSELNLHSAHADTSPSKLALLAPSKDRLVAVYRKHRSKLKNVKYSSLRSDFYDKIELWLKKDLLKNKRAKTDDEAAKFAAARVEKLKKDLKAKIDNDAALKDVIEKEPNVVLKIEIDSSEGVSVTLRDPKKLKKFRDALKAAGKKGADIAGIAKEQYDAFMKKTGFIGKFLDKFFNFRKSIFEYLKTGKKSWALSIAGMMFGAEVSRRALSSKSITSLAELQKLAKINGGVTKKRLRFKENVKLKGYKIVIPKGKGIRPGGKFKVALKGVKGKVDADPKKAKRVKSKKQVAGGIFGGLFGGFAMGRGKKLNMFKDYEITIAQNTEITAKTYIPKGARILKA